jgi:UDP-N-acetylmuramyl tripeptide synthase
VRVEPVPSQRDEQVAGLKAAAVAVHAFETHVRSPDQAGIGQQRVRLRERHHAAAPRSASAAIEHAVCAADAQDVILLAGKGHETYQEIAGVKRPFSDVERASAALALRGAAA